MPKVNRAKLVANLKAIAPALASSETIRDLTHFWFTGKWVTAFNDELGMSMPCEVPFQGGVAGNVLIDLLEKSSAREVEIEESDNVLNIVAGRTKLKLAVLPWPPTWQMPKSDKANSAGIKKAEFLRGVSVCLQSIGSDTSRPDTLGITLIPEANKLILYSTNAATISRVELPYPTNFKQKHVILPAAFCRQLLRFADASIESSLHLELHNAYALFNRPAIPATEKKDRVEQLKIFSRLIMADNPIEFKDVIARHGGNVKDGRMVMPAKLAPALDRALIITRDPTEDIKTQMSIATTSKGKTVLTLFSKSTHGELRDDIVLDSAHDDISIKVSAAHMRIGATMKKLLITPGCVIMESDNAAFYVGVFG